MTKREPFVTSRFFMPVFVSPPQSFILEASTGLDYSGLQSLCTECTMLSGFFFKKKPPCTPPDSAPELENRSSFSTQGE
jgi:hypothetical protein